MCAKAAHEFRLQPEYKNDAALGSLTFTSHFNKKLGKCLVKVTNTNFIAGERILEAQHVYDAFEGTVLGGEIQTKMLRYGQDPKVEGITMVRGGKMLGKGSDLDEFRETYAWFQTLMLE